VKYLVMAFCLATVLLPVASPAQLVVFDYSHNPAGSNIYDTFQAQLTSWGYTVVERQTPLMDNSDAAVIVILPMFSYLRNNEAYTVEEATWLKNFVDGGGGLFVAACTYSGDQACIIDLLAPFGITQTAEAIAPPYYDQFNHFELFYGVSALGHLYGNAPAIEVAAPSTAVAGNGTFTVVATYQGPHPAGGSGGALITGDNEMLGPLNLPGEDNLRFLENAFSWLTYGIVAEEPISLGGVKALFR
jgi:hypothetical protein